MTKLWERYEFTPEMEFKTIWEQPEEMDFDTWIYTYFVPSAEQYGFVFTDEQRQEIIDGNFGSGDRSADADESEYDELFAEELLWLVIEFFENLLLSDVGDGVFQFRPIYGKIILVHGLNKMSRDEIYEKAW